MKHPLPTTRCTGCGKAIVFARTKTGALVPCDPTPPLYFVYQNPGEEVRAIRIEQYGIEELSDVEQSAYPMVSHFATCTQASEFHRKGKG